MTPDGPELVQRLLALEERLSFQQRTIDELNDAVLQQDRRVELLGRELARLRASMDRLTDLSLGADLPHEKPPHY